VLGMMAQALGKAIQREANKLVGKTRRRRR